MVDSSVFTTDTDDLVFRSGDVIQLHQEDSEGQW